MQLVFVAFLWLAMAARVFAITPDWLFWVVLAALTAIWWSRRRASLRLVVAGVVPVALVFILTGGAAVLNAKLSKAANQFSSTGLILESKAAPRFGHLQVRIVSPPSLAGNGQLLIRESLPKCTSLKLSGNFVITPPSDVANAGNQFALRPSGFVQMECQPDSLAWLSSAGLAARNKTAGAVAGVSADSKALVLGLTDGDTQLLSKDLNARLKILSLTHLNAVSGANCAIVVTSVFGLLALAGLGRRGRVAGSLLALAAYLVLVGNQPSVIRAAAMACIALGALATGRRAMGLNVLAVAVLLLLGIWPDLAVNFGFALSALATWGVIQLAPAVQPKLQAFMPTWLAQMVAISLSAQLACLPVLVLLQNDFSVFSTVANVLVEPAVPVITVFGVLAALLSQFWAPLAFVPFWLASIPAQYLVGVTRYFSSIPASLHWPAGAFGVVLALALLWALLQFTLANGARRVAGLFVLVALGVAFSSAGLVGLVKSSGFASGDWFYVSCDVGQGDATVIRSAGKVAVIDAGREPGPVDACLSKLGISNVDLLVLTHFDLDHVGGVSGVLNHRSVRQALFTSFVDDRPGAQTTQDTVAKAGVPVRLVSKGATGTLGDFSWLVLSPHSKGADSIDSNDGSVTMFFHSKRVNLITLADLPETGQMRLAQERFSWWQNDFRNQPLVMKVSHHGSADQFAEFLEWLKPEVSTISVGLGNSYGHPTQRTLSVLHRTGSLVLRTDLQGSLSISFGEHGLVWGAAGAR